MVGERQCEEGDEKRDGHEDQRDKADVDSLSRVRQRARARIPGDENGDDRAERDGPASV